MSAAGELQTVDLAGPVHYVDYGGPDGAPTLVLVHGLGASLLSWRSLAERLVGTHRVLALDLVGFGHTEPLGRGVTVADNANLLARFIRRVVGHPVGLVGNSMGGMISVLTAQAHPGLVDSVVLVDPALPGGLKRQGLRSIDPQLALFFALYNTPLLGERFLRLRRRRLTPRRQVDLLLASICVDASRVESDLVNQLVAHATARRAYAWSDQAFLGAERSIMRMLTTGRKRYLAALQQLSLPCLLVHGEQDRLVGVSAARAAAALNPLIELVTLPDVGHAPQLEVPEELATIILRWHAGVVQGAV
ncbi:MAG: alpha/beta fold hydrolase [Euzebya sp.]